MKYSSSFAAITRFVNTLAGRLFLAVLASASILGVMVMMANQSQKPVPRHYFPTQTTPQHSGLSPSPAYGPLPNHSVIVDQAEKAGFNIDTFIDLSTPVQTEWRWEPDKRIALKSYTEEIAEFTGTAGPAIEKITVTHRPNFGEPDIYELKLYKAGDKNWKYTASTKFGNLAGGINTYTVRGYYTYNGKTYHVERNFTVESGLDTSQKVESEEGELSVRWLEKPVVVDVKGFLEKYNIYEAMRIYMVTQAGADPTASRYERLFENLQFFKVGKIAEGRYAEANLYLYAQDDCLPELHFCGSHFSTAYLVERPDNSLIVLRKPSSFMPPFVRWYDEYATLDLGIHRTLSVPKSDTEIVLRNSVFRQDVSLGTVAFTMQDGRDVRFDHNQCFAVPGYDGILRTYNIEFGGITWLDGSKSSMDGYNIITADCHGTSLCADVAAVQDGQLLGAGPLTLAGKTSTGEEVYEIVPEGRELRTPIPYMERLIPGGDWNNVKFPIQPTEFYSEHPLIFIKDAFGRYHRLLSRNYWAWC